MTTERDELARAIADGSVAEPDELTIRFTRRLRLWRDLVCRLVDVEPWSWSNEGLDDCCTFCGSRLMGVTAEGDHYVHDAECVWLEAMDALGRQHPNHEARNRPAAAGLQEPPT